MIGFSMQLKREVWDTSQTKVFNEYLQSLKNESRIDFTKKIYATNKECLAIKIPTLREIAKQIAKGNAQSFIDNLQHNFVEDDILVALLIEHLQNFDLQKKYIKKLLNCADSWVCTDTLKIKNVNFNDMLCFCNELYKSSHNYLRRYSFVALLPFAKYEECVLRIFDLVLNASTEQDYYVCMAISWLLCEIMINFPNKTIEFLINYKMLYKNKNNEFIIKKTIYKCQDSFRIDKKLKKKLKELFF